MKHLLFLFLLGLHLVSAQGAELLLQVRDIWTGRPVANATVKVEQGQPLPVDVSGIVRLQVLTSNTAIKVEAPGYFPETLKLKNGQSPLLIYLIPLEQTTFITVVGKPFYKSPLSIPSHRTVISFADRLLVQYQLTKSLALQSGLFLKSYGPTASLQTISLRGMSAEQTQVLIDGIPLNNLQLGSVDLSVFEGEDVGAVEIYRGSSALLGGSGAIGGSLNLRSRDPEETLQVQVATGWSSLNNQRAAVSLDVPIGYSKQLVTFSHANGLNQYKTKSNGQWVALRNRDFRQNHVSWKSVVEFAANWKFFWRISHLKKTIGSPRPFTNVSSEQTNLARMRQDNTLAYGGFRYQKPGLEFYFTSYLRNEWMDYYDPAVSINQQPLHSLHFNQEKGLQGRFHYSPRQRLLFKSGVEFAKQAISSTDAGQHGRSRASFYLLNDWRLFEKRFTLQAFSFNSGFRLEKVGRWPLIFLPSAGITLEWPGWQLFVSGGKNFRIPGFNDLYWVPGGNPDLKPEASVNWEFGLRNNLAWKQWLFQGQWSLFQNRVKNQIKWLPSASGYWQPFNIAGIKSRGLEVELSASDLKERLKIALNYHYMKTIKNKAEFPGDETVGQQVPFLPREKLTFQLQLNQKAAMGSFNLQYMSFRYTDFSNNPHLILPGFVEASLALTYGLTWKTLSLRPGLQIENLFNKHYSVLPGYPLPGRYFNLNLNLKFNQPNYGGSK